MMMNPYLGIYLFATLVLLLGFHPRTPFLIHSYTNKMFTKVFLVVDSMIGGFAILLAVGVKVDMSDRIFGLLLILVLLIGGISLYFVLTWSQSFSKKKMGIEAVDRAIELHKKPNERAIGIMGGWCPDLVVDGESYKTVVYALKNKNKVVGTLAFNLQGKVVRTALLMDKIQCCYSFAQEYVNPDCINRRASQYNGAVKARKSWENMLSNYKRMLSQLQEKSKTDLYEHAVKLQRTFEIYHRYNETLMDVWMNEARWGKEHGNTKLKVVEFEEVEKMEIYWKGKMAWWLDEYKDFLEGLDSAKVLLKAMKKEPILLIPGIRVFIAQVLKFQDTQEMFEAWEKAGEVRYKYSGLNQEVQRVWMSRMDWVMQIERWLSEGVSEDEIIEMHRDAE
jgi:hypothetical protein